MIKVIEGVDRVRGYYCYYYYLKIYYNNKNKTITSSSMNRTTIEDTQNMFIVK